MRIQVHFLELDPAAGFEVPTGMLVTLDDRKLEMERHYLNAFLIKAGKFFIP